MPNQSRKIVSDPLKNQNMCVKVVEKDRESV